MGEAQKALDPGPGEPNARAHNDEIPEESIMMGTVANRVSITGVLIVRWLIRDTLRSQDPFCNSSWGCVTCYRGLSPYVRRLQPTGEVKLASGFA